MQDFSWRGRDQRSLWIPGRCFHAGGSSDRAVSEPAGCKTSACQRSVCYTQLGATFLPAGLPPELQHKPSLMTRLHDDNQPLEEILTTDWESLDIMAPKLEQRPNTTKDLDGRNNYYHRFRSNNWFENLLLLQLCVCLSKTHTHNYHTSVYLESTHIMNLRWESPFW